MAEQGRSKTDRAGRFTLAIADVQAPHLVRVIHQGVTYHEMAPPGAASLRVQVYDVAARLDGITAVMEVQRFEATEDTLEVKQLVTIRNQSKPPRTLMNDRPFEVQLPFDARVQSGLVQVEDQQALKRDPVPGEGKGQYYFVAPIRPGDTRFGVVHRIPYRGSAVIEPQIRNSKERFVVMLPKSMKFEPTTANIFQPMPGTTPDNVQSTEPVNKESVVTFRVSGVGTLEELRGRRKEAQESEKVQAPRPGGGLGPPIDAPDPLHRQRWPILVGLTVLIGLAATWSMNRRSRRRPLERKINNTPSGDHEIPRSETRIKMNRRRTRRATVHKSTLIKRQADEAVSDLQRSSRK
jgi:hypothetical protein